MTNTKEYPFLVLFDGACNLCNKSVAFFIKRDKKKVFKFCPIQDFKDKKIVLSSSPESIIYVERGTVYRRSNAILRMFKKLGGIYLAAYYISMLIPTFIRDIGYNYVARNRYKWFGEYCTVSEEEVKKK